MRIKLIILWIALVFGLFTFIDCNVIRYESKKPKDFSFKLTSEIESYDSKTGIYTRRYLSIDSLIQTDSIESDFPSIDYSSFKGDPPVKVDLTESDWQIIYNSFRKSKFMSFPNDFDCSEDATLSLPAFSATLEISYNGLVKKVTSSSYCDKKIEQRKASRFDKLYITIRDIIISKPQVKKMKPCNLIFE